MGDERPPMKPPGHRDKSDDVRAIQTGRWPASRRRLGEKPSTDADIVIYLDEYDEATLKRLEQNVLKLAHDLGYEAPVLVDTKYGSIFRRWRAMLRVGVTSDIVRRHAEEAEQRLSLLIQGEAQAKVDAVRGQTLSLILADVRDSPNAVVKIGELLLVKTTNPSGQPVLVAKTLTPAEMRALDANPAIQRNPRETLELLATAVYQMGAETREDPAGGAPALPGAG